MLRNSLLCYYQKLTWRPGSPPTASGVQVPLSMNSLSYQNLSLASQLCACTFHLLAFPLAKHNSKWVPHCITVLGKKKKAVRCKPSAAFFAAITGPRDLRFDEWPNSLLGWVEYRETYRKENALTGDLPLARKESIGVVLLIFEQFLPDNTWTPHKAQSQTISTQIQDFLSEWHVKCFLSNKVPLMTRSL